MEENVVIQRFRTAVGGFNRQDVQRYIEQISAVHKQEMEKLQALLDKAESRSAGLEADISAAQEERDSAAAEAAKTKADLDESSRMVSRLRGELSQADAKLRVAAQELEQLKTQISTLEPLAASYTQMKDRLAGMELKARQQAQEIVKEAQAEGESIRKDTRAWLNGVLDQYGLLRQVLDVVLEQTKALSTGIQQMETLDETARTLREQGGVKK